MPYDSRTCTMNNKTGTHTHKIYPLQQKKINDTNIYMVKKLIYSYKRYKPKNICKIDE